MKTLITRIFLLVQVISAANQTGDPGYRPPYTDEDHLNDDEMDDGHNGTDDFFINVNTRPTVCNCLALSDSHNLGPYQAGVIMQLIKSLKSKGDAEYIAVSGIAVGAINAHILAQQPIGSEKKAIDQLKNFWLNLADQNQNLIRSWGWGTIFGFFYDSSLYDASQLFKFVEDQFKNKTLNRHINIGLANVLTGQFKSFQEHHDPDEFVKVLQASLSFPGVFKMIEAFDQMWFAGSSIYELDVIAPINYCRKLGYQDKDINVDVILAGSPFIQHALSKLYNAFAVVERTFELQGYYDRMFGVLKARNAHPQVNFRHLIGPNRVMPSKIVPVEFTKEEVQNQLKMGIFDAQAYLKDKESRSKEDSRNDRDFTIPGLDFFNHPNVSSSHPKVQNEQTPFHCATKKRYFNEERQKRHLEMCKQFVN